MTAPFLPPSSSLSGLSKEYPTSYSPHHKKVCSAIDCSKCSATVNEPCVQLAGFPKKPAGVILLRPHDDRLLAFRKLNNLMTARPRKRRTRRNRTVDPSSNRGNVLAFISGASGRTVTTADIIKATGLTNDQVNTATASLAKMKKITRVDSGVYRTSVPVESMNRAQAAQQLASMLSAVPSSLRDNLNLLDDRVQEIDRFLERLFPNGIQISHLTAINNWRESTMELIAMVSATQPQQSSQSS